MNILYTADEFEKDIGFPIPNNLRGVNLKFILPREGDPRSDHLILAEIFTNTYSDMFLLSKLTNECALVPDNQMRKAKMLVQTQGKIPVKLDSLKIFPMVANRNQPAPQSQNIPDLITIKARIDVKWSKTDGKWVYGDTNWD